MLHAKDWSAEQWSAVYRAVSHHMLEAAKADIPAAMGADWCIAIHSLCQGYVHAVLVDGYLIVYDVGPTWCSNASMLTEHLVLRVEDSAGSINSVMRALDALAAHHKCRGIATGNSVGRPGLTRAYERHGYRLSSPQLFKDNKWEN